MNSETTDRAKKKRFIVSIYEIRQEIVFADEFSDRYVKTVTLSDGTTRTVELTPAMCGGRAGIEFNDTGHRAFMGILPVRNGGHTHDNLMVRIFDLDDAPAARMFPPETSLTTIPELVPPGFVQGIEILNDNRTPMEFVVGVLVAQLGLNREDASQLMLAIHERGGALIATQSLTEAQTIAAQIATQAARSGHPLVCRAATIA
ncbi:MAG TPA: ATP-dependent Clp protease adaptor ClpS [Steroidobacteraceae bacterium]|jgi:ATP-dependent Clp protease adapter protein ClpS|nr:ATP-dependent Clp protease adaptor ClpS [Steroidobacteraceae bacterium]